MRRAEWLIAAVMIAMGLACMIISANVSRDMSILQIFRSMGKYCLMMMAAAGIVGIIYSFIHRSGRR
ncbi:hypothetical protein [Paenibacillus aceti]|uniref:Uncharacterized protein n=1 Tax=Paenibacillus aceti TaxID=1820010 RepID=A0ABQ1VRE5_9BACL|nr:hypothetical protein [Paenibacillus aceti]GGF92509.1 hypothetical protein GCM10010913_12640 [Paenibacillus aceti]